jgi:hypothetical protein
MFVLQVLNLFIPLVIPWSIPNSFVQKVTDENPEE